MTLKQLEITNQLISSTNIKTRMKLIGRINTLIHYWICSDIFDILLHSLLHH